MWWIKQAEKLPDPGPAMGAALAAYFCDGTPTKQQGSPTMNRPLLPSGPICKMLPPGPTQNNYQPPYVNARADSLQRGEIIQDEHGWRWQINYRCASRWSWPGTGGPQHHVYIAIKVTGPGRGKRRALTFSDLRNARVCGGPRWYAAQFDPMPTLPLVMVPIVRGKGAA